MSELNVECSHDPCNCMVAGAVSGREAYCGDFCRNAELDLESDTCGCGHPPCDEP